jgi:uncharacterized membrane protein YhaH (DUF805 family)
MTAQQDLDEFKTKLRAFVESLGFNITGNDTEIGKEIVKTDIFSFEGFKTRRSYYIGNGVLGIFIVFYIIAYYPGILIYKRLAHDKKIYSNYLKLAFGGKPNEGIIHLLPSGFLDGVKALNTIANFGTNSTSRIKPFDCQSPEWYEYFFTIIIIVLTLVPALVLFSYSMDNIQNEFKFAEDVAKDPSKRQLDKQGCEKIENDINNIPIILGIGIISGIIALLLVVLVFVDQGGSDYTTYFGIWLFLIIVFVLFGYISDLVSFAVIFGLDKLKNSYNCPAFYPI